MYMLETDNLEFCQRNVQLLVHRDSCKPSLQTRLAFHSKYHGLPKIILEHSHWKRTVVRRFNGTPQRTYTRIERSLQKKLSLRSLSPLCLSAKVLFQFHTNSSPKFQMTKSMNYYSMQMHWSWVPFGMRNYPIILLEAKGCRVPCHSPKLWWYP